MILQLEKLVFNHIIKVFSSAVKSTLRERPHSLETATVLRLRFQYFADQLSIGLNPEFRSVQCDIAT